ncbi:MAG: hypothetical protein ACHREM_26955, partial [Polyangiales bacterium]
MNDASRASAGAPGIGPARPWSVLPLLALAACAASASSPMESPETVSAALKSIVTTPPIATPIVAPIAAGTLDPPNPVARHDGTVLPHAVLIDINWGPNVDPATVALMPRFYSDLAHSTDYLAKLSEYGAGLGSFYGAVTIQPYDTNTVVDYNDILRELGLQITAGKLPDPSQFPGNGLYVVHLPPNVSLALNGVIGCGSGPDSFIAYHGSGNAFASGLGSLTFIALPDFSPNSSQPGCAPGSVSNWFNGLTFAASHEVIEAITNPFHDPYGQGTGWYSDFGNGNEIGDNCNGFLTAMNGRGAAQWTVTAVWSNATQSCTNSELISTPAPLSGS